MGGSANNLCLEAPLNTGRLIFTHTYRQRVEFLVRPRNCEFQQSTAYYQCNQIDILTYYLGRKRMRIRHFRFEPPIDRIVVRTKMDLRAVKSCERTREEPTACRDDILNGWTAIPRVGHTDCVLCPQISRWRTRRMKRVSMNH